MAFIGDKMCAQSVLTLPFTGPPKEGVDALILEVLSLVR